MTQPNTASLTACYLCGGDINGDATKDHVVPKQMIARAQPRARGYDYAGHIDTHADCNNQFGPERYLRSALQIIGVLHDSEAFTLKQHVANPSLQVLFVNADKLEGLSEPDLLFFKIVDGRQCPEIPGQDFFAGRERTNIKRDALHVAFSVLAKSSAALLVSRHLKNIPTHWKIYATAFWDESGKFDIDAVAGETIPFDDEVKAWIEPASNSDWQVAYRYKSLVVIFVFTLSEHDRTRELKNIFGDGDLHKFEGHALKDVLVRGWVLCE
ncbi:MAG TPA: hypothetical protein VLK26_10235 [Rudaea sp.]|nr:hypothetical protein [Rudaea sp.]